jgi:outer membrane receptor protein involved in Fe transport
MGGRSHPSAAVSTTVSGVLRALSICAPVALLNVPPTIAQTFERGALTTEIPARPLAEALTEFARQTGLRLVYVSNVVRNHRSHGAAAGLSADEALASMLQGTGLRFEYLTANSVRIVVTEPTTRATGAIAQAPEDLHEVIVTANRREEDLQDVPMTVQVLTGEALARLNATTFDDFVGDLPGLSAHGVGPAQNHIYVRGLGTAEFAIQGAGFIGSFPNVAVYLDDQSAQLPGRNLDVYAADLERIEVLEGPQGTLFGAGAQAGVVRYITNKPRLDVTEAVVDAGGAATAHGAPSGNFDATINIPLVAEQLAVRAVVYDERRGGYIDNSQATFSRAATDRGIQLGFAGQVPANSVVINNFGIAGKNINPVSYQGFRVEALYRIDEDWSALLAQSYQRIEADGVFADMAENSLGQPQPDLTVQLFNPSYDKDRFENTALTVQGRLAALKLIYSGSYLVRNVEQVQDYTNYARSTYTDYYQCVNPPPANPATAQCFTPSSTWHNRERNTHQSHELRVSTPGDWRLRGIGGLFYENYRIQDQADFFYLTAIPYFNPIAPPTGYYTLNGSPSLPTGGAVPFYTPGAVFVPSAVTSNNPNARPPGDAFFNDITRAYTQQAAYASIDYDLIPKRLTLTAGTRYSRTATSELGSTVGSGGCQKIYQAPDPCVKHSYFLNINAEGLDRTFSAFTSRANLSWKVTDEALLYYTWSQGFRAGGFNRSSHLSLNISPLGQGSYPWQAQANAHGGWQPPAAFAPDNLINNELGWKTRWWDQRIQWNGAIYQEDWSRTQTDVSVADGVIDQGITVNGGNYRVRGLETSGIAFVTSALSIQGAAAWSHSELIKEAPFKWADGTPINFSALQSAAGERLANPGGTLGSSLAGAPAFQGNIRLRYDLSFNSYDTFAQIGAMYQSHSLATTDQLSLDLLGRSVAYNLPAFTTYDAALGAETGEWRVQVYGQNLTDTRAQLYANYFQWYKGVTVSRPRTIGLRFSYRFVGS